MTKFYQVLKVFIAIALFGSSVSVLALTEKSKNALVERIKPVGETCLDGNPKCQTAAATSAARPGEEVYQTACIACHGSGIAGAPKVGDKAAWTARIAKGKDTLYKHAIEGFNAMPPKGACGSCSNEEIQAAVDFMVSGSK